tara:strand:- start:1588 stop:1887 length:300 start_codon:yes stop_codon:yes gene_type:complete
MNKKALIMSYIPEGVMADKYPLRRRRVKCAASLNRLIHHRLNVLVFGGRELAGKVEVIKQITQRLSPRQTRAVALPSMVDKVFVSLSDSTHSRRRRLRP